MAAPGDKTLRVSNMTRLILLGMVPLFANGESQDVLGRQKADGHGLLRNGSGRNLQEGSECGVDFPGVRSSGGTGKICCVAECGVCGGDGCTNFGDGLTGDHCCVSDIRESGVMCSEFMGAPCIIESTYDMEPTMDFEFVRCSAMEAEDAGETAFFFTVEDDNLVLSTCYDKCVRQSALYFAALEGNVCACGDSEDFLKATGKTLGECDIECPGDGSETCGGASSYNLYEILVSEFDDGSEGEGSGSDDVDEQSVSSSASLPTCSNGIVGVEAASGDVCCPHSCVTCGGDRCVGNGSCCEHTIQLDYEMCSNSDVAPCIINKVEIETPAPSPTPSPVQASPEAEKVCSNGLPGVESADGEVCCWDGCIECYGLGPECVGVTNCCEAEVQGMGVLCSDEGVEEGPCII